MNFREFARQSTERLGSPKTFVICLGLLLLIPVVDLFLNIPEKAEFYAHYVLESITLILAVLIQNAENRNSKAMHLKLDELVRAVEGAKTHWVGLEDQSESELEERHQELIEEIKEVDKEKEH